LLLLSLDLAILLSPQAFDIGCDILSILSPKQPFADSVAREGSLWRLLVVLERPEPHEGATDSSGIADTQKTTERKIRGWSVLEALSSSPSIATMLLSSSGWLELLGVLVGYITFTKVWTARAGAAKTLSRLLWDPTTGPLAGR
jgi:hypothetical protein